MHRRSHSGRLNGGVCTKVAGACTVELGAGLRRTGGCALGWSGSQCKVAWGHVSTGSHASPPSLRPRCSGVLGRVAGQTRPEKQQPSGTDGLRLFARSWDCFPPSPRSPTFRSYMLPLSPVLVSFTEKWERPEGNDHTTHLPSLSASPSPPVSPLLRQPALISFRHLPGTFPCLLQVFVQMSPSRVSSLFPDHPLQTLPLTLPCFMSPSHQLTLYFPCSFGYCPSSPAGRKGLCGDFCLLFWLYPEHLGQLMYCPQ